MVISSFDEGESFNCAGNTYTMLIPRDVTNCCEVVLERVAAGSSTPPNAHSTFVQVYVLMAGQADVTIGDRMCRVAAPAVAFIPKNTQHRVVNTGSAELQYLYMTVWPEGIPRDESEGGWKRVYKDMINEYAERGFPAEPGSR